MGSVGIPAGEGVREGVGKVGSGESGTARGLLLLNHDNAGCSVWEFFCGETLHVLGTVGTDLPKQFRVIAVFGAWDGFTAGTPMHSGFKLEGSPFADLTYVLFLYVFLVASEGVGVNSLCKLDL